MGGLLCAFRKLYWRAQGMRIGQGTTFSRLIVRWPHKVSLGDRVSLEHDVYFNDPGPFSESASIRIGDGTFIGTGCEFNISTGLTIGTSCLIAAGSRFVDHNHGTAAGTMMKEPDVRPLQPITLGSDVWIGANSVTVLMGVTIGDGAIVAAGSDRDPSGRASYSIVGRRSRPPPPRAFAEGFVPGQPSRSSATPAREATPVLRPLNGDPVGKVRDNRTSTTPQPVLCLSLCSSPLFFPSVLPSASRSRSLSTLCFKAAPYAPAPPACAAPDASPRHSPPPSDARQSPTG